MAQQAVGDFLNISAAELDRARRRISEPQWHTAAESIRTDVQTAANHWPALPAFDSAWFDARPDRPYAETYNEFAAYAYPAWQLLADALKLLLADALFGEHRHTATALHWTRHVVRNFRFHVKHHDAGLSYSHAATALASIYTYAAPHFSAEDLAACRAQLEACAQALRESTAHWLKNLAFMPYNNHFAHHRLGLLTIGIALDRRDFIDEALTGPRNFGELLAGSTMDDGLCYESSTVYHFVTLEGLLRSAQLIAHYPALGRDLFHETFANGRTLKQMFDAPLNLLLPNGALPAVGDCYYYRDPLWQIRPGLYEQAYAVYHDPRYAWLLQRAGDRRTPDALFYGADDLLWHRRLADDRPQADAERGGTGGPQIRTRLWVEHGYALLTSDSGPAYWQPDSPQSPVVAFLTGDRSGIHHHRDTMSIHVAMSGRVWVDDVEARAVELQGFAAPIQEQFNRTMLAHNLVVVDEHDQAVNPRPLPITEFKDLPDCSTVAMADRDCVLTPGVRRLRHLAVTPHYCLDVYQVASDAPHTYDWLLHPRADGPATCPALTFAPKTLPVRPPYSVLRDPASAAVSAAGATLQWSQSTIRFRCAISASASAPPALPAELIRAQWPTRSDRTGDWREMFMFRLHAPRADFVALYQLATDAPLWRVAAVSRIFNGQSHELRLHLTNGPQSRLHVLQSV